ATQRRRDGVLQRLRPVLAPVAASLALAVVILTSVVADQQDRLGELEAAQGQPAQQEIVPVLAATDARTAVLDVGKGRSARFLYSVDRNQAVLVTDGMEAPGPRKSYELWLFHDGEPRPAAVFNPDRKGRSIAVVDGAVAGAEVLAVTVEPAGGSPKPTGPIVASLDL
nr:anti-sigma factor [Euzebyales bacterium]